MLEKLSDIEKTLYQTKNQSRQDPLNFPVRLNNKLATLAALSGVGNFRPTDQAVAVKNELVAQIDPQLAQFQEVIATQLPAFNQLVRDSEIPAVILEDVKSD